MPLLSQARADIPVVMTALGGAASLPVPDIHQEQTEWCWATCIQQVVKYNEPANPLKQCELANRAFGQLTCCAAPSSAACNKPLPIMSVAPQWVLSGYNSVFNVAPILWDDVVNQIDAGRPFECALLWNKGGGHAVLVIGYSDVDGKQWVEVNDPWERYKRVLYSEFLLAYGRGRWRNTWTGIAKQGV